VADQVEAPIGSPCLKADEAVQPGIIKDAIEHLTSQMRKRKPAHEKAALAALGFCPSLRYARDISRHIF
jgi:hypothetical protein